MIIGSIAARGMPQAKSGFEKLKNGSCAKAMAGFFLSAMCVSFWGSTRSMCAADYVTRTVGGAIAKNTDGMLASALHEWQVSFLQDEGFSPIRTPPQVAADYIGNARVARS